MKMRKNPCFKCEERTIECHATCERYKEARKEHDKIVTKANLEKQARHDLTEVLRTKKR